MNTQFYNKLLNHAQRLINKYPVLPLNKNDLVHENWDFITENNIVFKKITRYFYDEFEKHNIPFSKFKNSNGENIPIEKIGHKKYEITLNDKQCKKCLIILPIRKFAGTNHRCNKCRNKLEKQEVKKKRRKKYYLQNKEIYLKKVKEYAKTERGKELRKLNCKRFNERHRESLRLKGLEYYQRNKEKIIAKRKEKRKLGLIKDTTAHARYLRYKNKMLLKKANANEVNFNSH